MLTFREQKWLGLVTKDRPELFNPVNSCLSLSNYTSQISHLYQNEINSYLRQENIYTQQSLKIDSAVVSSNIYTATEYVELIEYVEYACDECPFTIVPNITQLWDSGVCEREPDPLWFTVFLYIGYITIFVLSFVGNILVIVTVCRYKRMQTVTNYFIASMAVGDLLLVISCIPPSALVLYHFKYWPFGLTFCRFVNFTQVSNYCTLF